MVRRSASARSGAHLGSSSSLAAALAARSGPHGMNSMGSASQPSVRAARPGRLGAVTSTTGIRRRIVDGQAASSKPSAARAGRPQGGPRSVTSAAPLNSSRSRASEGLQARFDSPVRRTSRRVASSMRSATVGADRIQGVIAASPASRTAAGSTSRVGSGPARASAAPSIRRTPQGSMSAMMPGTTRPSVLESSRGVGRPVASRKPRESSRGGARGPQRGEVRRALATVAMPSGVVAVRAAQGEPVGSTEVGRSHHPGIPLRRSALSPQTPTSTSSGSVPVRRSPAAPDRSARAGTSSGRSESADARRSLASRAARRTQGAMSSSPVGALRAGGGNAGISDLAGGRAPSSAAASGSSAGFRGNRPRPGGAVGPVRRREVPTSNRPVGWSAALAGIQAGRREQPDTPASARSTSGSSSAQGSSSTSRSAASLRRSVVRRSGGSSGSSPTVRRSGSGAGQPGGTWSAADLAGRLERGESVPSRIERTVRRSPETSSSRVESTIRRESSLEGVREQAPENATPASLIGGREMSTSRMLDIQAWIAEMVEERLALELERRGLSGDRW